MYGRAGMVTPEPERFANYLTDLYLVAALDPLPSSEVVSTVRPWPHVAAHADGAKLTRVGTFHSEKYAPV